MGTGGGGREGYIYTHTHTDTCDNTLSLSHSLTLSRVCVLFGSACDQVSQMGVKPTGASNVCEHY